MNTSEKEHFLKDLDHILMSINIKDMQNRVENLKQKIYKDELTEKLWRSPYGSFIFLTALIIVLLVSVSKLLFIDAPFFDSLKKAHNGLPYNILDIAIYFIWLLGPPIFLLVEYIFLFGENKANRLSTLQIADLKYCQELGSKVWAAVILCLSIILLIKYDVKL
ncbi:hypothetical protein [Flavobacterium panacagri]|uniref:hypothetical protein n=1 Tax=Flavobacterium panacagri TaxID=3034146 RepID=UPI0025A5026E|nr:hypothetical protein [Flavobacterium panacagri]